MSLREKKWVAFTAIHKVKMIMALLGFGPLVTEKEKKRYKNPKIKEKEIESI